MAHRAGVTPPATSEGLAGVRLLCRSPGVTFQRLGLVLASRTRCGRFGRRLFVGRPAHRTPNVTLVTWSRCFGQHDAPNGLRLRACDRFASDLQRVLPTQPYREALTMLLIGRDVRPCPSGTAARIPKAWSLASPAVESGTPPGHDKEPSRASERAARPLKQTSCDDIRNIA